MYIQAITKKSEKIQQWVWKKRINPKHQASGVCNRANMLFFGGIEYSGIDYLAQLMKKSSVPIDVHDGPLENFTPRLSFNKGEGNLALNYSKTLPHDHPLFHVYDLLTHQSIRECRKQQIPPKGKSRFCVIKETHALLATEALLRNMDCKMLLMIDDPLSIVAQQVAAHGSDYTYLKSEADAVQQPEFLTRFLRNNYKPVRRAFHYVSKISNPRGKDIKERILTVALIQHMFRILAARYPSQVTLITKNELSRSPEMFQNALSFLTGNRSQGIINDFIEEVSFMTYSGDKKVWENSWPLSSITTGGLTSSELSQGFKLLKTCGLNSN
ncbi:MAG: hypothetical protein ABW166_02880 [Sedimenticola sp.]